MDIEVSARTLREVEFREKLRGYNQDDVDEFLERAAAGVELLHDRLRQAMERAMRAEQRVADLPDDDDALRRTLVLAQRTADMAVKESQQQARETIMNAQNEARAMVTEAEERARRTTEEAERDLREELVRLESARQQLHKDIILLERHVEEERGRMRAALANAAAWVDQNLSAMAPPPSLSEVDVPPPAPPRGPSREGLDKDGVDGDRTDEPGQGSGEQGPAEEGQPFVGVGTGAPSTPDAPHAPRDAGPQDRQPGAGGGIFDAEQWEGASEDNPTRIIRVQGSAGQHAPTRVIRGEGPAGGRGQV
ncbi:MAG TPA: DivIVA domain-containing protein [Acidimicrobiales bacterium]|nr:DivIVA domain-containing protein [Acidimicrobiales bacterium]